MSGGVGSAEGLTPEQVKVREDCIQAAGEIYGSILADPVRAAQIRAGRAAAATRRAAELEREEDSTQ